ncbi:MAG: CDP-diacylglycerol--glycerol-3-phosphate 3-phosphatidyltransferase [Alphaproteobacteria bacterium RIFCSPLOWO2_01_FULL_40_26]|nr:MAG: CDP-diacylglycerol--glycerol-3-phosphate 3-phosphatidyltransferase [Alphaproteobacteria bacterium RIFCSPHIGHO2_02_FULL_40_34]OFW86079.1 MAG: CDP-diacylglycerol--glycerol-3-phosphate 3-phosphatidyltransferase [Alphaproteobacteria bacterium RIFCSPHIGHO2_01_FULL_40_8]OFW95128.1 MAG: CDP-diacylglycerol--glycerol-3-phosphate 3-phosphatidyltransferase [Alphaproteobacteria bacterium RIFCSPLOWO2_01_FULL_40_26]OFX09148.1 MAG: CDP-diacylglycerol--glycerol-3-phosphate 3-phosphatidyltransferase [Alp
MRQLPNFLTTLRLIIIPLLILSFYIPGMVANIVSATLFGIAAITDYFDGYFARSMRAQSNFGKCLDPIADKLLVIVAIVMLIRFNPTNPWILFPGLIIICREVLVSGLREFLAELHVSVPVSKLAKYKTAVQMFAIGGLLLGDNGSSYVFYYWLGGFIEVDVTFLIISAIVTFAKILFCLAAVLTVVTGYAYFRIGFKNM